MNEQFRTQRLIQAQKVIDLLNEKIAMAERGIHRMAAAGNTVGFEEWKVYRIAWQEAKHDIIMKLLK